MAPTTVYYLQMMGDDCNKCVTFTTKMDLPDVVFTGVVADAGSVDFEGERPHVGLVALAIFGTLLGEDPEHQAQYGCEFSRHASWLPFFAAAKEWIRLHVTILAASPPPDKVIFMERVSASTFGDPADGICFASAPRV